MSTATPEANSDVVPEATRSERLPAAAAGSAAFGEKTTAGIRNRGQGNFDARRDRRFHDLVTGSVESEDQLAAVPGPHPPDAPPSQRCPISDDDRSHEPTIHQQRISEPQLGAAGRPHDSPLSLSEGSNSIRKSGPGASPGDHLSPVVDQVDRPPGLADRASIQNCEEAGGIYRLTGRSEQALQGGICGELLARRQHLSAVAVELGFQPVPILLTTGRPDRDDQRNDDRQPWNPRTSGRTSQHGQARAHDQQRGRCWIPARPGPAHCDRSKSQKP
jgi:hypothetical protein